MYLGMATTLLGVAVAMGSLTPFIAPVAFVLIITFRFIRLEEAHMVRSSRRWSASRRRRARSSRFRLLHPRGARVSMGDLFAQCGAAARLASTLTRSLSVAARSRVMVGSITYQLFWA